MWVFVGAIAVGALFILFGGVENADVLGKIMGTLLILALLLAVASNNFRRLEDEKKSVQCFALVSLVAGIIGSIFGILACWGVFEIYTLSTYNIFDYSFSLSVGYTVIGKIMSFFTSIATLGFFASNIIAIKEYDKAGALRPLKIAAVIGLCYDIIYSIIVMLADHNIAATELNARLAVLAGFAGAVWIISALVALIISRSAGKQAKRENIASEKELLKKVNEQLDELAKAKTEKSNDTDKKSEMSEEEKKMREEIEKRVRAEMMEKEIREKVEAEMKAKKASEE